MKYSHGFVLIVIIVVLALLAILNKNVFAQTESKVYLPLVSSSVQPDLEPSCYFYEKDNVLFAHATIPVIGDKVNFYNEDNVFYQVNTTGDFNLESKGYEDNDFKFFFGFSSIIDINGVPQLTNKCKWFPPDRNVGADCIFPYQDYQFWFWVWGTTPVNKEFKVKAGFDESKLVVLTFGDGLTKFKNNSKEHYAGFDQTNTKVCRIN